MGIADFIYNVKKLFEPRISPNRGSQRPLVTENYTYYRKDWGLEINEIPIRSPDVGMQLIEMRHACSEVRACIDVAIQDTFANEDGDVENPFMVADFIDKEETIQIHPETKQILEDLFARHQDDCYVIGGDRLEDVLDHVIAYGDSFLEVGIEQDANGSYYVARTLTLPSWEIFRIENNQGVLERFEQRKYLSTHEDSAIVFEPHKVIHAKYTQKGMYGESPFKHAIPYWDKLKEQVENIQIASRNLAVNPNVHRLDKGMTKDQDDAYKENVRKRSNLETIVTDIFIKGDQMDVTKIANVNPTLKPLLDVLLQWRSMIFMQGMPPYFFFNINSQKARDISGSPDRRYSRLRLHWCRILTKVIRRVCDLEIKLRKGQKWFEQHGQYRIVWTNLVLEQTNTRNPDELTGINNRGNDGEED